MGREREQAMRECIRKVESYSTLADCTRCNFFFFSVNVRMAIRPTGCRTACHNRAETSAKFIDFFLFFSSLHLHSTANGYGNDKNQQRWVVQWCALAPLHSNWSCARLYCAHASYSTHLFLDALSLWVSAVCGSLPVLLLSGLCRFMLLAHLVFHSFLFPFLDPFFAFIRAVVCIHIHQSF